MRQYNYDEPMKYGTGNIQYQFTPEEAIKEAFRYFENTCQYKHFLPLSPQAIFDQWFVVNWVYTTRGKQS